MISAKKLRLAAKQGIRGHFSPLALKALGREFNPGDAIVISGYFRSGTTWLAELVSKAANAGIVFEPFHVDNVAEAKSAGFSYNNFRRFDEEWPAGKDFAERVLSGKILNSWTAAHIPVKQAVQMRRLVVKLVASNQMLVWLTEQFDLAAPALLIRHPCAVLSSWLNRGWRLNDWIMKDAEMLACHPEITDILDTLSKKEEYFAAKWCIDHYVPLSRRGERKFKVVAFEKLVADSAPYLEEVLSNWNVNLPDFVRKEMKQPSDKASAELSSNYDSVSSGWRNSLSSKQQERVLRVVRDFGLDFYTSDIEPDYERLFGPNPVRDL